ncbi:oxysterol-binding protein-related protein 11-like isoform X3 [Pomacea canaliculata]|uniref:oxysterol-binding protein-related protein 11-like isoform X3 n=1 Tax=Pomacea canaliculata TaxID=400727 RepID=UPI000D727FD5|nr:oxysterol-binding protein-related protein 11-like isoform X3 [Pomacea canaliculata]
MAADSDSDMTFALPDLSGLSEAERLQVIAVMQRAKEFEEQEQTKNRRLKMEGHLLKYTNVMKGWQTRWFLMDPESGMLEYFEKEEHKKQRPRGSVHLAAAVVSPSDEDSQTFTVTAANGETFKLRANDAKERQHWVDRLRSTAEYHTANIAQQYSGLYQRKDAAGSYITKDGTLFRRTDPSGGRRSHYSSQESVHSTPGNRKQIPAHTHALPLPFTDVQGFLVEAQDFSQSLSDKIATLPYHGEDCFMTGLDKDLLMLKATSGAALRCVEECLLLLQNGQVLCSSMPQSTSVSGQLSTKKSIPCSTSLPADLSQHSSNTVTSSPVDSYGSTRSVLQTLQDCNFEGTITINRDEEEEDSDVYSDSELGAVEEHKSIILHLLSQLKLGMDLTKVVLPTFILERRSLLEMFADCMAHPHIFLQIPDVGSPEERMLLVLEWYLTSFHAGRQGSVAKKPYNPIKGETFHCSWRLPQSSEEVKDITSCQSKQGIQLTYCAEQVSHHPPVSAFYFECPEKKICMNASIWTKSRFMGMSIGVVMVGKVSLRLLQYDEEYVFGLPSAYARSILTVPWVELGDKVSLVCEKTNLTASIIFHTRPFYGGKLHRVSAEVKNTTGAQLCKVSGEWNGIYEFVYSDGRTRTVDTQKLKIWRKCVRPVEKQGEFESRRLWQHVTNALNAGDVNTATEHKHLLEERQREGERHRKDSGTVFPTKLFHLEGDTWVYNKMLKLTDCPEDTIG